MSNHTKKVEKKEKERKDATLREVLDVNLKMVVILSS